MMPRPATLTGSSTSLPLDTEISSKSTFPPQIALPSTTSGLLHQPGVDRRPPRSRAAGSLARGRLRPRSATVSRAWRASPPSLEQGPSVLTAE